MMHLRKHNAGFTLVEVLTVTMILVITGSLIAGVVTSVIRGTNKANISTAVGQNGNYSLSVITNRIVTAKTLVDVDSFPDGICKPRLSSPSKVSGIVVSTKNSVTGVDENTTLSCSGGSNGTITSQTGVEASINLTDSSQVIMDTTTTANCYFLCTQENVFSPPIIEVGFTLTERAGGFFDLRSTSEFKTSIQMRNYVPN